MKKFLTLLFMAIMAMNANSVFAKGSSVPESTTATAKNNTLTKEEFNKISSRVQEIRNMDRKNLTTVQRAALKKELTNMKEILSGPATGVYVSSGALLIILIVLLIILL